LGIRFFQDIADAFYSQAARLSASGSCLKALTACKRWIKSKGSAGLRRLQRQIHRRVAVIEAIAFQAFKNKNRELVGC